MPRTTIALDDALLRQLKLRAARENRPLQAVVNDLLRRALRPLAEGTYKLAFPTWKGVQNPAVDICDRNSLGDAMDPVTNAAAGSKYAR